MKRKADRKTTPIHDAPAVEPEAPKPPPGYEILTVTTLDQLQAACDTRLHVKVALPSNKGITVALIPVRMLRPNETEQLELILKEAQPPMQEVVQPDGRKEMQYIPTPETLEKAARLQRICRALALWWACPLFKESDQGKQIIKEGEKRDTIFDFVQSKFTESILDKLYQVCRSQEFQLEDRVNFTTPPG